MNPLYTAELTPRTDLPAELCRILDEALRDDRPPGPPSKVRVHFAQLAAEDQQEVVAYCEELDCLHEDLGFLLSELDQAVEALYHNSLHLKRLAIISYSDSYYFRVHAYREKVFKLVKHFLGLPLQARAQYARGPGTTEFNESVVKLLRATRRSDLAGLLETFHRDKALKEAIHFRRLATHARAHREWPTITAGRRIDDQVFVQSAADELDRETDLDRLHRRVQKQLGAVGTRLDQFRRDLIAHLERAIDQQ